MSDTESCILSNTNLTKNHWVNTDAPQRLAVPVTLIPWCKYRVCRCTLKNNFSEVSNTQRFVMSVSLALLNMLHSVSTWQNMIKYFIGLKFHILSDLSMISVPALPVISFSLIKLKLNWNCNYIMLLFQMFQLFQNMIFIRMWLI